MAKKTLTVVTATNLMDYLEKKKDRTPEREILIGIVQAFADDGEVEIGQGDVIDNKFILFSDESHDADEDEDETEDETDEDEDEDNEE